MLILQAVKLTILSTVPENQTAPTWQDGETPKERIAFHQFSGALDVYMICISYNYMFCLSEQFRWDQLEKNMSAHGEV